MNWPHQSINIKNLNTFIIDSLLTIISNSIFVTVINKSKKYIYMIGFSRRSNQLNENTYTRTFTNAITCTDINLCVDFRIRNTNGCPVYYATYHCDHSRVIFIHLARSLNRGTLIVTVTATLFLVMF